MIGEVQVGSLYRHEAQLALWKSYHHLDYDQVAQTEPYDPILVLELSPDYSGDRWARVLAGGRMGWLKVHYLDLEPMQEQQ